MKFRALVLPQSFSHRHTADTQTDRYFPQIVKSCSGHPKTYKSIKNQKSKIFMKPILSSVYIKESNYLNVKQKHFFQSVLQGLITQKKL